MHASKLIQIPAGTSRKAMLSADLGHPVQIPCHVVRGRRPGPTLLVTAGVHGAEYASIAAAYRVARTDPAELAGTLVVVPIVNPPSFSARSIYVNPIDGKNLNRVFPGKPDGTFAERLAHWLCDALIRHADAYVDLHGGDLIEALTPFSIFDGAHEPSRELATAFGLPYLIEGRGMGSTYTAASGLGVPAVLAEAGGQGRWPEEAVALLVTGVERVMQHLSMRPGTPRPVDATTMGTFAWTYAGATGCWYPQVSVGERVAVGQRLGTITDLLGDPVEEIDSKVDGDVLFAVTSLAIHEGDPLVGIGA